MKEGYKLVDTIVLNGIVDFCNTYDEQEQVIGIKEIQTMKKLKGELFESVVGSFPFTKEMEERCGWGGNNFASIQMLTGQTPIDMEHLDETKVVSMEGDVESYYYHRYSEYTGYLWTEEGFKAGGHDIPEILESHVGEYIHMEIELYEKV